MIEKIHEFDPVIYPYKLWIVVDKQPEGIAGVFRERNGADIIFENYGIGGVVKAFTMEVKRKKDGMLGVVILFRKNGDITFQDAAHEATHAAKYLFEHINADMTEHEPFEYVVGWIAKCCEKVKLNKTK